MLKTPTLTIENIRSIAILNEKKTKNHPAISLIDFLLLPVDRSSMHRGHKLYTYQCWTKEFIYSAIGNGGERERHTMRKCTLLVR